MKALKSRRERRQMRNPELLLQLAADAERAAEQATDLEWRETMLAHAARLRRLANRQPGNPSPQNFLATEEAAEETNDPDLREMSLARAGQGRRIANPKSSTASPQPLSGPKTPPSPSADAPQDRQMDREITRNERVEIEKQAEKIADMGGPRPEYYAATFAYAVSIGVSILLWMFAITQDVIGAWLRGEDKLGFSIAIFSALCGVGFYIVQRMRLNAWWTRYHEAWKQLDGASYFRIR